MANISVFGLGYVGCVGVGCLAKLGHHVIGYDVDANKVNRISKGLPTIVERDVDDLMMGLACRLDGCTERTRAAGGSWRRRVGGARPPSPAVVTDAAGPRVASASPQST